MKTVRFSNKILNSSSNQTLTNLDFTKKNFAQPKVVIFTMKILISAGKTGEIPCSPSYRARVSALLRAMRAIFAPGSMTQGDLWMS
jgi:hypothetical protein